MTFSPVDPTGAPSGRRAAVVMILAGLLLGLHALLAWWLRAPAITTGHDDAVYLLLARSLRHFSYHDAWLVGTPPEAQYPPLYPAVLALVGAVLGDGLDTALALNVLLSTFALGVFFALVRRWSPGVALLGLAVCAVNPWLIRLAGLVASEPLFLVLVALTLWLLAVQPATGRSRIAATATAVAAMLTRLIGVTLAIALVGQWLIERRFRAVAAFGGASALLGGAWLVWTAMAPRGLPGQSYIADAFFREPAVSVSGPDSGAAGPRAPAARAEPRALLPTLVTRIGRNVRAYAQTGIPSALALPTVKKTAWDNLFWLLVLLGFGVLGLRELWRNLPAGVLLLGSYTLVLLLWPYSIERYFVPVVPLAVLTILLGSRRIGRDWPGWRGWVFPILLAVPLVVSGLGTNATRAAAMSHCERAAPYGSPGCFAPEQRAFFTAVFEGAREAPAGAAFLAPKMATLFYLTGRRSVDVFRAASLSPDALREFLSANGVQYILLSRVHRDQQWLAERVRSLCHEWELRGEYAGSALLLRRKAGAQGSGKQSLATCEAIDRFTTSPW